MVGRVLGTKKAGLVRSTDTSSRDESEITSSTLAIYTIIGCLSVGVSKLQVAILARSSWEMSQTVRID